MYLVMEQTRIEKPEMEIACLVEKVKNVIQKGVTTPPPPIPAIVDKAINTDSIISPPNSME